MQPPVAMPTFTYSLPDFSGPSPPTPAGIDTQSAPKKVIPIEDLPPLRKPTPVAKGKRAPRRKAQAKTREAAVVKPSSSPKGSPIEKVPEGVSMLHQQLPVHTTFPLQLADASPVNSDNGSTTEERHPQMRPQIHTSDFIFQSSPPPLPFKQTHPVPAPPDASNKRVRFQVAASPDPIARAPLPNLSNTSKGKGKAVDTSCYENISASSPLVEPVDSDVSIEARARRLEQERFRVLENLIVDKIHDEDFCKLLCDVSRVWQRMGFEDVFKDDKLFDIGEQC